MHPSDFNASELLKWVLISGTLSSFFSILLYCYQETGEAGVVRLFDKHPPAQKRLAQWQEKWKLLLLTLRMYMVLAEAMAICCLSALAFQTSSEHLLILILATISGYAIFLRIIPHVLSESYADRITMATLPTAALLAKLTYPIVWPLNWIETTLLIQFRSQSSRDARPSPEDEIKELIKQAQEDEFETGEREIIRSAFNLDDTVAREIMTPRVEMDTVQDNISVRECLAAISDSRHSRFPVIRKKIDNIKGIIHVKDLLRLTAAGKTDQAIATIQQESIFIPETMPISGLLKQMQKRHAQVVMVVDEYGGTSGLVSMEDIIEELVGEIEDEYDLGEIGIHKKNDGTILVDARMPVDDLNEKLNLSIPKSEEYDTMGGYLLYSFGRIPQPKESLEDEGAKFTIQTATTRQIQTVLISPKTPPENSNSNLT